MIRSLTVKREIRTLGLDLCNPRRLVGAVTRGGGYLDGALLLPWSAIKTSTITSAISGSRFFPELRLIMTHDPQEQLDANGIERSTKLPVIQVDATRKRQSDDFRSYKVGPKQLQAKSSLPPRVIQDILFTVWTTGVLPEPLRIAHLLARSQFFTKNAPSKLTNKFAS